MGLTSVFICYFVLLGLFANTCGGSVGRARLVHGKAVCSSVSDLEMINALTNV